MFSPFSEHDIEQQRLGFKTIVNKSFEDVANNEDLYMYAYGFLIDPLTRHPVYTVNTCSGGNENFSLKITQTKPIHDETKEMWEVIKKFKVNGKVLQYSGKGLSLEEAISKLKASNKTSEIQKLDPDIKAPVDTLLDNYEVGLHVTYCDELQYRYKLEISMDNTNYFDTIIVPIKEEDVAYSAIFYNYLESGSAYSPQVVAYLAVCSFLQACSNFISNPPSDLVFQLQHSVKIENVGLETEGLKSVIKATLELTPDLIVIYKDPKTSLFKGFNTRWKLITEN